MSGPLAGLTILEMSAIGPVPLAGQLMADLGATVIIIDRASQTAPDDDINRRNKKSVSINLKHDAGREVFLKLLGSADILVEGFRPGVMEKLRLDPASCHEVNPALIYGRMTGWGQQGPLSQTAGHDINYLAITGALHAIGARDGPPIPPLNLVADYAGGSMFLVMGVLSALYERQQSGKGQTIDAAMIDGVPSLMGFIQTLYRHKDWTGNRQSNLLDGGAPYYRCYETADGKFISVGAIEKQFFKEFIVLAGLPESDLAIQNNTDHWPDMHLRYEARFLTRTREQWMQVFEGTDACVAPVLDFSEAPLHKHNQAREVFRGAEFEASPAPRFDRTPASTPAASVARGSNTGEILRSIGLKHTDLERLRKEGVIT